MNKLTGYRLKDPRGCFHDAVLKVFISGEDIYRTDVPPPMNTLAARWVMNGGLIPVYGDQPDIAEDGAVKLRRRKLTPIPE